MDIILAAMRFRDRVDSDRSVTRYKRTFRPNQYPAYNVWMLTGETACQFRTRTRTNLGTYNVNTLMRLTRLAQLCRECRQNKPEILGQREVRWKGCEYLRITKILDHRTRAGQQFTLNANTLFRIEMHFFLSGIFSYGFAILKLHVFRMTKAYKSNNSRLTKHS